MATFEENQEELNKKYDELETSVTKLKRELELQASNLSSLNNILGQNKNAIVRTIIEESLTVSKLRQSIDAMAKELPIKIQQRQNIESQISLTKREIGTKQSVITSTNAYIAQLQKSIVTGDFHLRARTANKEGLEHSLTSEQQLLQAAKKRLTVLNNQTRGGTISHAEEGLLNKEIERRTRKVASVTDELSREKNIIAQLTTTQDKKRSKLQEAQDILDKNEQAEKDLNVALKDSESKLEELNEEIETTENKLKTAPWEMAAQKIVSVSRVLDTISKVLNDLVKGVRDFQQQLGINAGAAAKLKFTNLISSIDSYASTILSFEHRAGVSIEQIEQAQQAFQAEFGGVITTRAATDLARQAKELGVSTQQLATARRVFMTQTMGNVGEAKRVQDRFMAEFTRKGLTSKDAMEAIGNYSELLARNGTRFATSFARAAADAKKIGVDLGKVDQIGDNIIGDFEGFLEKSAELGAMGFGFDTSRLAEIAESGDTGALFTELRSQLASTGKDITKLRRSEQLALSNAFGIPMAELQRLAQRGNEGSGEQLTEQGQTNQKLERLVNFTEGIGKVLSYISTGLGALHTLILWKIERNTSKTGSIIGAFFGTLKGWITKIPGVSTVGGFVGRMFGRGTPGVGGVGGAIPEGGPPGAPVGGGRLSGFVEKLNPVKMLAGAGAMLLMASALWVTAKAIQEFKNVDLESLGMAGAALLGLTVAIMALGALITNPLGASAMLVGAASMLIIAGALWVLGKAIASIGTGLEVFIPQMSLLGTALRDFPIARLAAFGAAALLAAPGMVAMSIAGVALSAAGRLLGMGRREPSPTTPTTPSVEGAPLNTVRGTTPPTNQQPAPVVNVDLASLERKFDQLITAMRSMEVRMDGNRVGQVVVAADQRAATSAPFRLQRS